MVCWVASPLAVLSAWVCMAAKPKRPADNTKAATMTSIIVVPRCWPCWQMVRRWRCKTGGSDIAQSLIINFSWQYYSIVTFVLEGFLP